LHTALGSASANCALHDKRVFDGLRQCHAQAGYRLKKIACNPRIQKTIEFTQSFNNFSFEFVVFYFSLQGSMFYVPFLF